MTKDDIRRIFDARREHEWSLQGFGLLRTYLSREGAASTRLHVWDSRYRVPGVTTIHTHPWHFTSEVIAGVIANQRFECLLDANPPHTHMELFILCGEGAHGRSRPRPVVLMPHPREVFTPRSIVGYQQFNYEVHESSALPGTVTVVQRRVPAYVNPDIARVFYPAGGEWVDAAPRPATDAEVDDILDHSLRWWF